MFITDSILGQDVVLNDGVHGLAKLVDELRAELKAISDSATEDAEACENGKNTVVDERNFEECVQTVHCETTAHAAE